MTRHLEARQRYISEFAADVAHEFKSPAHVDPRRSRAARRRRRRRSGGAAAFSRQHQARRRAARSPGIASARAEPHRRLGAAAAGRRPAGADRASRRPLRRPGDADQPQLRVEHRLDLGARGGPGDCAAQPARQRAALLARRQAGAAVRARPGRRLARCCYASPTTGPASRPSTYRGCSSASSRPTPSATAPAWAWPSSRAWSSAHGGAIRVHTALGAGDLLRARAADGLSRRA